VLLWCHGLFGSARGGSLAGLVAGSIIGLVVMGVVALAIGIPEARQIRARLGRTAPGPGP
jgi:hypothetical protein